MRFGPMTRQVAMVIRGRRGCIRPRQPAAPPESITAADGNRIIHTVPVGNAEIHRRQRSEIAPHTRIAHLSLKRAPIGIVEIIPRQHIRLTLRPPLHATLLRGRHQKQRQGCARLKTLFDGRRSHEGVGEHPLYERVFPPAAAGRDRIVPSPPRFSGRTQAHPITVTPLRKGVGSRYALHGQRSPYVVKIGIERRVGSGNGSTVDTRLLRSKSAQRRIEMVIGIASEAGG